MKNIISTSRVLAAVSFGIALFAITDAVVAQQNEPASTAQRAQETQAPRIPGVPTYDSPYAQAIGLFGQNGAPIRAKGISSITHPAVGVYCITVTDNPTNNSAPIVTVEWGRSLGVALFAQFRDSKGDCGGSSAPRNVFNVRTYKGDSGGVGSSLQVPVLSNRVAFLFVLP
ncbi:hypothetical protein LG047_02585 [Methylocystis sp. WRRC1]|uniref:hypothetical protein n=1 Tax=Methylocystis sp. WRRC1 TaxID=1732014 RepID=UPI001D133F88|nr:hypothetical protein [Methylocystis sp. WRRC1]MCC3244218.1 hypothetical protein [Methylocystis sp. WRRC1]